MKWNFLKDVFADTVLPFLTALPLGYYFNKIPKELKIVFWYLMFTILFFFTTNYLADNYINNLFLYHIYTPLSFLFISAFYYKILVSKTLKKIVYISAIFLIGFSIVNSTLLESVKNFDVNTILVAKFFIVIFSLFYFTSTINSDNEEGINKLFQFWIVNAFFIYSTGTISIFAFFKYASLYFNKVASQFWDLQSNILILHYLLMIIGIIIWITKK